MEKKRKQLRLNLAFRVDDAAHIEAYKRLAVMPKTTDYVVALMRRESSGAQAPPVEIDTQALCAMLLPLVEEVVGKAVKEALMGLTLPVTQAEEPAASQRTIPSNMELGLKGLAAFY